MHPARHDTSLQEFRLHDKPVQTNSTSQSGEDGAIPALTAFWPIEIGFPLDAFPHPHDPNIIAIND